MRTGEASRINQITGSVKEVWAELAYAERRRLEKTSVPGVIQPHRPPHRDHSDRTDSHLQTHRMKTRDGLNDRNRLVADPRFFRR